MVRLIAVLAFCLLALGASPEAHAAKRVAFVAGIDAYDNLPEQQQLKKAINDARAVGETLESLGYAVQKAENVGRLDFLRQWQLFLNRLDPGDEAAVFFAGHGVEINRENFLLPRDVPRVASGEEEVLKASGLSLSDLLDQVSERRPQVTLYILDACRDNPFVDGKGRGIGGTRGLARIEPPSGTFIMFSASAKESALDRLSDSDPNPNSVYTRTLLPRLKASGRITEIARDVRRDVHELAASVAHKQTPAIYDEMVGDFCPAGCEAKTAAVASPAAVPQAKPSAPPAEPSAVPPVETAAVTPQAVQRPAAATRAPILDCDRLAADPNNPDSAVRDRDFEEVDHVKAVPACEEAARLYPQERRFAFQLARAHLFARQFDVARPQFEALSRDGYAIATTYLGIALADSKKGSADGDAGAQTDTFRLIRQAADAGDALGAFFLAQLYEGGIGVAKDEAEALRWVRKAADAGNAMAMNVLADKYAEGRLGLAKDDAEAAAWLRKAADLGSTPSLYRLALMNREGRGVPKDETEAARLFQQADDRKRPKAMIEVGGWYGSGKGVVEDKAEALRWYRKAADLGDRSGMFYVGLMYRYGQGVAKDSAEAARWYRKSAELGDSTAMTQLAEMYNSGEGVPVDTAEGARWRAAAETGSVPPSAPTPSGEDGKAEAKVAAVEPSKTETRSAGDPSLLRNFGPFEHDVVSVAFSPDGKRIYALVSGGYFMQLDPANGAVGAELGLVSQRACCQMVVSPDGKHLASGNYDNLVLLWDAETGDLVRSFKGHSDYVVTVAFSPDGKRVASGSNDGTIRIWDADTGKQLRSLDPRVGKTYAIALSPDGKLIASGHQDGDIKIWDSASGRLLHSMKADNSYGVYSLVFTPDSTRLLSTGADSKVRVWDLANATEVIHFGEGYASICCVALSPDGKTAATGNFDNKIMLWNVASGASFGSLDHADWLQSVVFSPDGSMLASGSNDDTVKLWDMGGAKAAAR